MQQRKNGRHYIDTIFRMSDDYLSSTLTDFNYKKLKNSSERLRNLSTEETIREFSKLYRHIIKQAYQSQYNKANTKLNRSIHSRDNDKVKIIWDDCLEVMQAMDSESIHLMVTSPPYYNAREYSQWANIDEYLADMKAVVREAYRVLDNHRAFVFNIGDITGNDNRHTRSSWGDRRIPLGAYFINIFEEVGFTFIDDFIWDKGEVQSQRHKNGDTPFPLYQYPLNCYEHIMIFRKHRLDETRYPCPICGCLKVNGNAYSGVGIKSWECKNTECFERSLANRGKRFSLRSIIMDELKNNIIDANFIKTWRRDIIKFDPVIKINNKKENRLGHTAPFPTKIPEFAVKTLSGRGEVVFDPFAGSFTTPIEAVRQGRIGIGAELNKESFGDSILNNIQRHGLKNVEIKCPTTRMTRESLAC